MAPSAPGSNACRNYTQTYTYDAVGNITELQHSAGTGSYTRTYTYPGSSNRLSSTQIGGNPAYSYTHDTRGNIIEMPHLSAMDWNNQNQLSHITRGTTEAYYQYSNGQRIRKYVDKVSEKEERIYLGNYEVYRKYDSGNTLIVERETVHISDDTGRIAMLEVRTQGNASDDNYTAATLTRYIYSNHLQSASLELDGSADIISYEEYHPYGTTAYQAADASINAVAKRYRYTGKERDEESGLYYHGARYYMPWLCRWCACDPLESKYAGWSSYNYCTCNPINHTDSTGMGNDDKNNIKIYGQAEVTNSTLVEQGATHSDSLKDINYKDVIIKPAFDKNDKLIGYNVYDNNNIKLGHPILQMDANDLQAFKENYSNYMTGARLYYMNGEPSEGMKKISAGYVDNNKGLFFEGLKEENKAALTDPVFVGNLIVSLAHMGVGITERMAPIKSRVSNNQGVQKNDYNVAPSFDKRHIASKVSYTSIPKENNTVALKGVDYKQDVFDINLGLAKETNTATKGKVFELKNGNSYYLENNALKPLPGGRYVTLDRQEFKLLQELNKNGTNSPNLKYMIGSGHFSYKQVLNTIQTYLKSR